MHTETQHVPGNGSNVQRTDGNSETTGENVQISQPHTERAEGPFEHSGETAGWTDAEKVEKEEGDPSGQ